MSDDTISRQAAIEVTEAVWAVTGDINVAKVGKQIKDLPTARSEPEEFEWCSDCKEYDQTAHCCHRWTKVIRQTVAELKAEQPKRRGKWIKMSDADGVYWACSECGEDIPRVAHYDPQFDLFPRLESIEKTNFCPNCGCDMRGET